MSRAVVPAFVCLLLLAIGLAVPSTALATNLEVATIKAGLRTADVEQGDFIERIVAMSRKGDLPADMVESTFLWARRKPDNQFQYFKRALIVRAAKRGIVLR